MRPQSHIDMMSIVGVVVLFLFVAGIVNSWTGKGHPTVAAAGEQDEMNIVVTPIIESLAVETPAAAPDPAAAAQAEAARQLEVALPYDEYVLTQGIHGESYGHAAVDIAAGNGSPIHSLINGTVTGTGYDQWGNTYIQIENDVYAVLYMHGQYTSVPGDAITAGQQIGTESNIGYTLDMYGNLCAGRDCGYHTHLNVFDKRVGANIDPLTLIPANYP